MLNLQFYSNVRYISTSDSFLIIITMLHTGVFFFVYLFVFLPLPLYNTPYRTSLGAQNKLLFRSSVCDGQPIRKKSA